MTRTLRNQKIHLWHNPVQLTTALERGSSSKISLARTGLGLPGRSGPNNDAEKQGCQISHQSLPWKGRILKWVPRPLRCPFPNPSERNQDAKTFRPLGSLQGRGCANEREPCMVCLLLAFAYGRSLSIL